MITRIISDRIGLQLNFVLTFKSILTTFLLSLRRSKKVLMSNQSGLYPSLWLAQPPIKKVGTTPSSVSKMGTFGSCRRSMANLYKEICWNKGIKTFLLKKTTVSSNSEKRLLDSFVLFLLCCFAFSSDCQSLWLLLFYYLHELLKVADVIYYVYLFHIVFH